MDQKIKFDTYARTHQMSSTPPFELRRYYCKFITPGSKVLDIGCGDGKDLLYLKKNYSQTLLRGVEVSPLRVKRASKIAKVKLYDGKKLPYHNKSFNTVILNDVIEHIPFKDISPLLDEIKRVLKEKGKFIVVTPNYPTMRLYRLLSFFFDFKFSWFKDDPTHCSPFNTRKLCSLITKKFKIIELKWLSIQSFSGKKPTKIRLINKLFAFLSNKIILVGIKETTDKK